MQLQLMQVGPLMEVQHACVTNALVEGFKVLNSTMPCLTELDVKWPFTKFIAVHEFHRELQHGWLGSCCHARQPPTLGCRWLL